MCAGGDLYLRGGEMEAGSSSAPMGVFGNVKGDREYKWV